MMEELRCADALAKPPAKAERDRQPMAAGSVSLVDIGTEACALEMWESGGWMLPAQIKRQLNEI